MTDPPTDGAVPPLTRSERRRQRSRSERRRARRNAKRARDRALGPGDASPQPRTGSVADPTPDDPTLEQPLPPPQVPEVAPVVDRPDLADVAAVPGPPPDPDGLADPVARVVPAPAAPAEATGEDEEAGAPTRRRRGGDRRARRRERAVRETVGATTATTSPERPEGDPVADPLGEPVPPDASIEPVERPHLPAEAIEAPAEDPSAIAGPAAAREFDARRGRTSRSRGRARRKSAPARVRPVPETPKRPKRPKRPRRSRDSRRFWTRVMPAIGAALALAVGVGVVVRASGDSSSPDAATRAASDSSQSMLLVHHSEQSGNDLIAVAGRGGTKGSVLLVPPAVQLSSSLRGAETLAEIPVDDGGAALANSVENIVGIDVGTPVIVDDAALTAMLGPATPMSVDLADPVDLVDRTSKYPAGTQQVSAAQAAELLGGQQSVNQLDRMVTVSSVLDAWLDRLRDPGVACRTVALSEGMGPLAAVAGAPDRRIDTLAVESIATGGGERYRVQEPELADYVGRAFRTLRLGRGTRPRVEILNGTGALGVDEVVADAVVPAGGKVTLTENVPGFGVPTTQIVYYEDRWRADAQRLLEAMNCGSLRKAGRDVGIADVTIVVGADCPKYGTPGGTP